MTAIEFPPVIVLAAFAARTRRHIAALIAAVGGVYLLTDVRLVAEPLGTAFAVANAVLFAFYIVLGHRVARSRQVTGIDGLALSMLIAAVIALPIGIGQAAPAFTDRSCWPQPPAWVSARRSSPMSVTNSPWPACPAPLTR